MKIIENNNFLKLLDSLFNILSPNVIAENKEVKFVKECLKDSIDKNPNWSNVVKEVFKHGIDDSHNTYQLVNAINACALLQNFKF